MFGFDDFRPKVPEGFCMTCKSPMKYRRCVACAEEDRDQVFWSQYFQVYKHKVTGELEIYRFHDNYLDFCSLGSWNDCEYFAKAIGAWDEIKDLYRKGDTSFILDKIDNAVNQARPILLNRIYELYGSESTISASDLERLFEGK